MYERNPHPARAYLFGVQDGFAQPIELQDGITWGYDECGNADALNEAYDRGANLGQVLGWLCRPLLWLTERPQPWSRS